MRVPRSQEQEQCALHESRPPLSMLRRELGIRRSSFEMLRNIDSTGWLLWPLFTWGNKTTWWPMIFHHRWSIHPNQTTIGEVNGPLTRKPRVGWLLIGKLKGLRKDNRRSTASTASHPCCLCLDLIWPYLLAPAEPCRFSATSEGWKGSAVLLAKYQLSTHQVLCTGAWKATHLRNAPGHP